MRSAVEINKVFKHNFKRNIEIFKCFVLGHTVKSISEEVGISESFIKKSILKKAERSIMYASAMRWDQMPGAGMFNYKDFKHPDHKAFYLDLIEKALAVNLDQEKEGK